MELKLNTVTLTVASLAMLLVVNSAMAFIAEDEYLGEEYDEAQTTYSGVPVFKPTEACSSFGGLCVHEEDCSESTSPKGLCAERGANLECCYIVKERKAPCREFGGECTTFSCPNVQVSISKVTDCDDKNCCIWM